MPFNGVSESCCVALRKNEGLYTQCPKKREVDGMCKGCAKKGSIYGTTMDRAAVGLMEYIDPKGNKVVPYVKIMKKLKITREEVLEEAVSQGITVNEIHFEEPTEKRGRPKAEPAVKKEAGKKGRPRKEKPVIEIQDDNHTDLFESLLLEAKEEAEEVEAKEEHDAFVDDLVIDEVINEIAEEVNDLQINEVEETVHNAIESAVSKSEVKKAKAAEKEAKALAKAEAEKAKALAKAEAEKAKAEAKEKAKAEKPKAAKPKVAKPKAEVKAENTKKPPKNHPSYHGIFDTESEEEEEEPDVVKKINFEGKVYLKSKKTGIIYDFEVYKKTNDQVVVGMWNEERNCIIFQKDEEEEEEEEYEA